MKIGEKYKTKSDLFLKPMRCSDKEIIPSGTILTIIDFTKDGRKVLTNKGLFLTKNIERLNATIH